MKKGKKYQEAIKKYDRLKFYNLEHAIKLVPKLSTSNFVGSVEAHIKLNLTSSEAKQPIKGTATLPFSFGREKKVLLFCEESQEKEAIKAGADFVGLDKLIKKIQEGWFDFDIAIATPTVMPKIAILGRELGTKGLMPNPKNGTITTNIEDSIKEFKSGKITFKSDKQGIVHVTIGKTDSDSDNLKANLILIIKKIIEASKRSPLNLLSSVTLAPTMGPGVKIDINELTGQINN